MLNFINYLFLILLKDLSNQNGYEYEFESTNNNTDQAKNDFQLGDEVNEEINLKTIDMGCSVIIDANANNNLIMNENLDNNNLNKDNLSTKFRLSSNDDTTNNSTNYSIVNNNDVKLAQTENELINHNNLQSTIATANELNSQLNNHLNNNQIDEVDNVILREEQISNNDNQLINELQTANPEQQESIITKIPINLNDSKVRTITLKLPPFNGQKQFSNLVLINNLNTNVTPTTNNSNSNQIDSTIIAKSGTTRPVIQTINPTPKLVIKPLRPPSSDNLLTKSSTLKISTSLASSVPANASSTISASKSEEKSNIINCIKDGCKNRSNRSDEWDMEYCSTTCLIAHCKECFDNWLEDKKKKKKIAIK